MSLQKLQFKPGINKEITTLSGKGGWFDCDKIRFRFGFPEKIGGWAALTYNTFLGVCRSLFNWISLRGFNILGVGTNLKFYVEDGGTYYDVTPIRLTTTNQTTFSATPGSSVITVTDLGSGNIQPGDFVTFSSAIGLSTQAYTADASTDTLTLTSSLPNNTLVNVLSSGTPPGGLSVGVNYYIINSVGTTCQLALTSGGSAIDILSAGTGSQSISLSTGITASVLNQEYQINTVTSGTVYTIIARSSSPIGSPGPAVLATSFDVGNGGPSCDSAYQISTGQAVYTQGTGWGAGPWNAGSITDSWAHGWGTSYITGIGLQLRLWSQSNFGQELLFSPRGGSLYVWDPGPGTTPAYSSRGTLVNVGGCPTLINQILVSDSTRIVIAFGANDIGSPTLDPMLIRWSAQEDFTDWTVSATTQAGSFRLSRGSEIIGAVQTRQEILVWTDAAVYAMQYLGPPLVYGFTLLADNISLIGPNAMVTASGVTFWMGVDKFYVYSGRVDTLPCSVRRYVYEDINLSQSYQFFAGTNEGFNEIWWFYCSANSNVIDRYVIYNYLEKAWYPGTLNRTAWLDSPLRSYPMAATTNNLVVYHEAAVDDGATNPPSPITAYVESSDFDISEGDRYGFVYRMVPDVTFDGSNTPAPNKPSVTIVLKPRKNPGSAYGASVPDVVDSAQSYAATNSYEVQQFTEIVFTRARGREMSFRIESNNFGTQWQLGTPRMDIRPDGRR
jgi:hypothetical protein